MKLKTIMNILKNGNHSYKKTIPNSTFITIIIALSIIFFMTMMILYWKDQYNSKVVEIEDLNKEITYLKEENQRLGRFENKIRYNSFDDYLKYKDIY